MKKTATQKTKGSKKTTVITTTREASTGKFIESTTPNLLKNRPFKIKFF